MRKLFAKEKKIKDKSGSSYQTIFSFNKNFSEIYYIWTNDIPNRPINRSVVNINNEYYELHWIRPPLETKIVLETIGKEMNSDYKVLEKLNGLDLLCDFKKNFKQSAKQFISTITIQVTFERNCFQLHNETIKDPNKFLDRYHEIKYFLGKVRCFSDYSIQTMPYIKINDYNIDIHGTALAPRLELNKENKTLIYESEKEELFAILNWIEKRTNKRNALEPSH